MGAIDRFASLLSSAGGALQKVSSAIRSPNVAPSVELPGVNRWQGSPKNVNKQLAEALGLPETYLGRISYDAGPTWTRFSTYPASDLTPEKILGAQQDALAGYPLSWMDMIEQVLSRHAHLSGIAQQRVDDVVKGSWRLGRSTNDDPAACVRNFCEETIRGIESLEDGFAWLLWSNAYCYNATEIVWKRDRVTFPGPDGKTIGPVDVIVPYRLDPVHPKHFRFDIRTDEPLLWLGTDQVSLPYGKFVFQKGEGQHPITERRGYMWPCVWLSMFKSIGWAGWAVFVERFGLPTPLVEYDGDVAQYAEHRAVYEQILQNLGKGFGAIVPGQNLKISNLDAPNGGRSSDPHSALSDACDAAQSIRILGATLTAKIGNVGSFAASTTHADVKYAREEADARRLWSTLRSDLMRPMIEFNAEALAGAISAAGYNCSPDMIRRRVPKGNHRVPREIDPVQRATIVDMAINQWGLKVGVESLMDDFNLPQAISHTDVAPGTATQVTSGGALVGSVRAATEGVEAPQPGANSGHQKTGGEEEHTDTPDTDSDSKPHEEAKAQAAVAEAHKIDLTSTDLAVIVTVNEARKSQGLPPLKGEDGDLTVAEFKAKHEAIVSAATQATEGSPPQASTKEQE